MNDTSPVHHDAVSVTEIADFFRQLRGLSQRPVQAGGPSTDQTAQLAAERAAFQAHKADLLARIAAQHPDLAPPSPADGDPADGGPA